MGGGGIACVRGVDGADGGYFRGFAEVVVDVVGDGVGPLCA